MTAPLDSDNGQCVNYGNLTIYVGPEMECIREDREDPRWCFHCRKRLGGTHRLMASVRPSWYDPHWEYDCDGCGEDHRLGFGMVWEYAE